MSHTGPSADEDDVEETIHLSPTVRSEMRNGRRFIIDTLATQVPPDLPPPPPPMEPPPVELTQKLRIEKMKIAAEKKRRFTAPNSARGMVSSNRHDELLPNRPDATYARSGSGAGATQFVPQRTGLSNNSIPASRSSNTSVPSNSETESVRSSHDGEEEDDQMYMKISNLHLGHAYDRPNRSDQGEEDNHPILITRENRRDFIFSVCPRTRGHLECYIRREKGSKFTGTKYYMYVQDGDQFLMSAKKRTGKKTPNYVISIDKDNMNRDSGSCVGKVRSNFTGTQFHLFDSGANPKEAKPGDKIRIEFGSILYEPNILGRRGPRKMTIYVPKADGDCLQIIPNEPGRPELTLFDRFQQGQMNHITVVHNKSPTWNEQLGAYVLNFGGRVTQASVKNFQLTSVDDESDLLLQFGRVDKDLFTLDFKYPLLPIQAMGIAISSLDNKLCCE